MALWLHKISEELAERCHAANDAEDDDDSGVASPECRLCVQGLGSVQGLGLMAPDPGSRCRLHSGQLRMYFC